MEKFHGCQHTQSVSEAFALDAGEKLRETNYMVQYNIVLWRDGERQEERFIERQKEKLGERKRKREGESWAGTDDSNITVTVE